MTPCTVTTGFFVLRRCGSASVSWCPQCRRPLCGEHQGPNGLCPECAAAYGYGSPDPHHPGWAWGYRRHFYQRSSQAYSDATWYSTFDSYDRGAFEPGNDWSTGGDAGGEGYDNDDGLVDS
ncbi:hypothetical protein [Actinomadura sp. 9N407]|uniref:hypothetical protein n=1 Tax=Actinomadura sp. 9N407 TaxID=3375154 RepID=UPI003790EC41